MEAPVRPPRCRSIVTCSLGKELAMAAQLHLDTFIVPYREIVPADPRMSSHKPVFPAIAYSLISGSGTPSSSTPPT
jgi:hypothetical protein